MADIKFEIKETLGAIAESAKGWKGMNIICWNGKEAKYDLREWKPPDHEKMGKGVTLTNDELKSLRDLLNSIEF